MNLTFKQLSVICAVARHQKFTMAAKALHLTQPGVSTHIKQIEATIGFPLFRRVKGAWQMTRACRDLLPDIEALFAQYDRLLSRLVPDEQVEGGLSIAVPSGIAAELFAMIRAFQLRYDKVQLEIDVSDRLTHYDKLADGVVDCAFMGVPTAGRALIYQPVFSYETVVISPRDRCVLPAGKRSFMSVDLCDQTWIVPPPATNSYHVFQEHFAQPDLRIIQVNNMHSTLEMVSAGMGLSVMPRLMLSDMVQKSIDILPVVGFPIQNQTVIAHADDVRITPALRAFVAMAVAYWS